MSRFIYFRLFLSFFNYLKLFINYAISFRFYKKCFFQINTIDYRHHFLPLEINELLVYLNKLSTLATKSIHLSTEKLMVEDELTSTLIESKIVDIISKQVVL